jgi:RHS repeat-associated protein
VPLTGYTGHVQTEPNGLIYMRERFYSPAWHVFLNSDQGADPHFLNQDAYAGGNPFINVDPTGASSTIAGGAASGTIIGNTETGFWSGWLEGSGKIGWLVVQRGSLMEQVRLFLRVVELLAAIDQEARKPHVSGFDANYIVGIHKVSYDGK